MNSAAGNGVGLMAEQAWQRLVEHLRDGRLRSGAFLSMPVLVAQLDMPIAAVREAVKRAEAGGLLTVLPKRGVAIMEASPAVTRECLELRAIFDSEGARRLVNRLDAIPLAALRESHERLRDEAMAGVTPELQRRAIETDLSLHDALARGVRSDLVTRLYAENRLRVAVIQNQRPFLPDRIVSAMTEHLEIMAALQERDAERVVAAIGHHLENTLRWWGITPERSGPTI